MTTCLLKLAVIPFTVCLIEKQCGLLKEKKKKRKEKTHKNTQTHAHIHTHKHTNTHIHTDTHTRARTNTHTHTLCYKGLMIIKIKIIVYPLDMNSYELPQRGAFFSFLTLALNPYGTFNCLYSMRF